MHELSLASAIVGTVAKHARGRRVLVVNVRAGALRQVVPESLEFYFGLVARDTVCAGATLELDVVAARIRCVECGRTWDLDAPVFRCSSCGGNGEVVAGDEFEVESIEVEEEDAECTAPR